jgi:cytoskeletal protein RodZ
LPVEPLAAPDGPDTKKKNRMGVFSLVLVVPMAAGVAYGVLNSASQKSENPAAKPVVASVTPAERQPNKSTAANASRIVKAETPLQTASIAKAVTLTKKQPVAAETPRPAVKADARVDGIYEVTRTSRVYSAPSEFSQLLGDVEPGLKVNVVNARDGWLEIHSKHGRPPGFIRKEAARAVKN